MASRSPLSWLILQPELKLRKVQQPVHAAARGCSALSLPFLPILGTNMAQLSLRQARNCECLYLALQLAEKQRRLSLSKSAAAAQHLQMM